MSLNLTEKKNSEPQPNAMPSAHDATRNGIYTLLARYTTTLTAFIVIIVASAAT